MYDDMMYANDALEIYKATLEMLRLHVTGHG